VIEIIDVSRYQDARGPIDWQRVAAAGIRGVYVKATEGATYVNPSLADDFNGAAAAGLLVGVYHYLTHANAAEQAAHLVTTLAALDPTVAALPWALDVETGHDEIAGIACDMLAAAEPSLGEAAVYTYEHFQAALRSRPELGARRLWLAAYRASEPVPGGPWAGQAWWGWQYSGKGRVDGVVGDVDRSRIRWPADPG